MRIILLIIGNISLALGILGIILPLLPTTPFLLLSLACFTKSSDRLYNFILSNKYLAPYVEGFIDGGGIPMKVKIRVISVKWLAIGFTVIFVIDKTALRLMLLTIATLVSIYIYTRETAEDSSYGEPDEI